MSTILWPNNGHIDGVPLMTILLKFTLEQKKCIILESLNLKADFFFFIPSKPWVIIH